MNQNNDSSYELGLLLSAIDQKYGYDFSDYAQASLNRRFKIILQESGEQYYSQLIPKVLHEPDFISDVLQGMSVTVTEMFRDPEFFKLLRTRVIKQLHTYPFIKLWVPGCATGEEIYSFAILLKEEDLYDRTQIYATDINQLSLKKAKEGIYSMKDVKKFTKNYQDSGGINSFAEYFTAGYGEIKMNSELLENVTFASHNLASDSSFGEMNLISCRNVLIYFNQHLQDRVLNLFSDSLLPFGYLCLGTRETIDFSKISDSFESIEKGQKIYKKQLV